MVAFSWNRWIGLLGQVRQIKTRRPRTVRLPRVEGLEDRALLTANLPVAVNDTYQVDADTVLNGSSVLANDTDADGDTIDQAQISSLTSHGTLSLASDGTFTYTPDPGFSGTDSFTYFARDSINSETSAGPATVSIIVGATNNAPTANPITINVAADTTFVGGLTGSDPQDDPLTFAPGSTLATHGTVSISSDGSFTYTPGSGYIGPDSFSFKVNDGTTDSADAIVTVNVGAASNQPPVATSISIVATKDTVFAGGLSGSDPNGDPITFFQGSTLAAHGTVSISTDGNFTYTPDVGYTGPDSFSFGVSDGVFSSVDDGIVTVQVNNPGTGGNSVPVADSTSINVALNTTFAGGLSASDADGDPLVFSTGSTAAQHGSVAINANGTFTYTPQTNYVGTDSFSFKVSDGIDTSSDAIVTVQVGGTSGNTAPVGTSISINVSQNTTFSGGLSGFDADGDPLTFLAGTTLPAHGTVNISSNGNFTYIPDPGYLGADSFTFRVNDGTANSADATASIQVGVASNTPPVANSVNINAGFNTTFSGGLSGSDADGDPLTFSQGSTLATHGVVSIASDGSFTYTPDIGYTGTDSFSFKVNDGTVDSADATVSVTVSGPTNTAPVATPVSINVGLNTTFNGGLSGTDADGDALTFSSGSTLATHGTVSIAPNGSFTYTPNAGYTGSDSFSFKVNDGTVNSAEALVSIQVGTAGNTIPTANSISINVAQNTAFGGTLSGSDVDGDPLTFLAGSVSATNGSVIINSDGSFIYNPFPSFTGGDLFSFIVNDGNANSAEAVVSVTVGVAANSPPVATPKSITVSTDTTFNGTLTGTDADFDPLTFSAGSTLAAHGTVIINSNGTFSYTPDPGFTGSDTFSFKVNDGTVNSADAIVSVTVGSPGNQTPIAFPATVSTSEGTTLTGTLSGSDADGDPLTFSLGGTPPAHGTVTVNSDSSYLYTPDAGFTGFDLFTFKVNDGTVDSPAANVVVNVLETSSGAPTVTNGSGSVIANVTFNGSVSPLATDPDADPLTFSVGDQPAHGTLVLSPDGTFIYIPDVGFTGSDSFTFRANDGSQNSNLGTFNLTVSDTSGGFTLVLSPSPGTIATSVRSVVPLDSSANLANIDPSVSFANAAVTANIVSGASSQDRFVLTDGGSVDIRGRKIRINGTEVARISGGRRGAALQIAFNSSATGDDVQAVIQRIGLKTSRRASNEPRVVEININADGFISSATVTANKA